ncbi:STAS domain-containing protein [Nonomuraea sp. CA-141351]|uniref:STAS domain-containing protein n=1 Tax=Nonomuraea sp. CA-141351 TaxID=3239996 RepID=UPI003D8B28EF
MTVRIIFVPSLPEIALSPLRLECQHLDGVVLITVIGEVDITNADQLDTYIRQQMLPGRPVVLDLGRLTFMDSTGLQVLADVHVTLREQGTALHVTDVHGIPARALQITGLWSFLNIHSSAAEVVLKDLSDQQAPPT